MYDTLEEIITFFKNRDQQGEDEYIRLLERVNLLLKTEIPPILNYIKDPKTYQANYFLNDLHQSHWDGWIRGRGRRLLEQHKDLFEKPVEEK